MIPSPTRRASTAANWGPSRLRFPASLTARCCRASRGWRTGRAIIRSLHQPSSDHVVGSHNVLTGWYDETEGGKSRYPDLGSVISRMRSGVEDAEISIGASTDPRLAKGMRKAGGRKRPGTIVALPRYIDIGGGLHRGGPAFLGPIDGPFQIAGDPSKPGFVDSEPRSPPATMAGYCARRRCWTGWTDWTSAGSRPTAAFDQIRGDRTAFVNRRSTCCLAGGAARAFDLSREKPDSPRAVRPALGGAAVFARPATGRSGSGRRRRYGFRRTAGAIMTGR